MITQHYDPNAIIILKDYVARLNKYCRSHEPLDAEKRAIKKEISKIRGFIQKAEYVNNALVNEEYSHYRI